MSRELYLNESFVRANGKTVVSSVELTFYGYDRYEVLGRIDGVIERYRENLENFGFTNIKYWLTDYDVQRGEY
ncbi:hypothetical protein BCB4_0116 [Bacillus phage B4]|uniref:Uncharacterized protein n=2 Tax=Bequatrovirus B4 TaxID=1918005 RepID=J9PQH8_9CAUD|nr:hypothetical protein BCB4_0116 [Bacillus phage B4]YP_009783710.1 hypothetical protein QLX26_gp114 [Bacillus phage B5S]AEW47348.1 hypothetical protein B5S_0114 [Bacillus phage B5S]AEZ65909.1 hypothetical protein BCB4_0116 [Bacillus phage B4]